MPRARSGALTGALALSLGAALALSVGADSGAAVALPAAAPGVTGTLAAATDRATATAHSGYVVLTVDGASSTAVADALRAQGATVSSVNEAIGLITVSAAPDGFLARARAASGVQRASVHSIIGSAAVAPRALAIAAERHAGTEQAPARAHGRPATHPFDASSALTSQLRGDPLDASLWDMQLMNVPEAHLVTTGDRGVTVAVIDTGIDATHPDLAANVDTAKSRNFVTDLPVIDGPCETADCVDPVNVDEGGHGTHVAGTIAAVKNGFGMSGVAPGVTLLDVRAGQDSGYFFLGPVANAITYAADAGVDVANLSFYVDPWMYNCPGGAPEDTAEQAAEQDLILETMARVTAYATAHEMTLVAALGNDQDDIDNPRTDVSSPNFREQPHPRTIRRGCLDLPVQGRGVVGVSAVGPSARKADYSNYTTSLTSGSLEVSAPGGWYRDGFGTATDRTNTNMILSTAPLRVLQEEGAVDAAGDITLAGRDLGVVKQCTDRPAPGAAACGYYQYMQGTSMAAPHAAGVAALIVSRHGRGDEGDKHLAPALVRQLLARTATPTACPAGGVETYAQEGRSPTFTARCVGIHAFNGFHGFGIVNALEAVSR